MKLVLTALTACLAFAQAQQVSLGNYSPNISTVSGSVTIYYYSCFGEGARSTFNDVGVNYQPSGFNTATLGPFALSGSSPILTADLSGP